MLNTVQRIRSHSHQTVFHPRLAPSPTVLWRLYWLAAAAFIPTLFLQYVGEEAVTVIVTQEMWASGDWAVTTLYGTNYGRPGLFSWLLVAVTSVVGWANILVAARFITIVSTILTGLTLAWLVRRVFSDRQLAALAALVFLSGDVLLYRGWLSYVDPLFSLCAFAAMACLWVAVAERRSFLLLVAVLALVASFLVKTLTGYVFYAVFALVLLCRHTNRAFLLRPVSLALHAFAVAAPFAWDQFVARGQVLGGLMRQFAMHLNNLEPPHPVQYVVRLLFFPLRTVWVLLPVSAVVMWVLIRRKCELQQWARQPIEIAFWALLINLLPYWLAPDGGTRYLLPLYPLFALVMAFVVISSGVKIVDAALKALMAGIALAYATSLLAEPLYEHYFRGSYSAAAAQILDRAGDHPIYATDMSSLGVSIAANLNALRNVPVTEPPTGWTDGWLLSLEPDQPTADGRQAVVVGHRTRYLLCRGAACKSE